MSAEIVVGDCRDVLAEMDAGSVDAVVCDPPYDLTAVSRNGSARQNDPATPFGRHRLQSAGGFMGQRWDSTGVAFDPDTWHAVLRVLKPGGSLLAFGGPRTYHRMACAVEDAGFDIKDCLMWLHGQGFPKHKSQLKPAYEPILLARKPGPGWLNIDATRIGTTKDVPASPSRSPNLYAGGWRSQRGDKDGMDFSGWNPSIGRWPANILLDESAAALLDAASGERKAGSPKTGQEPQAAAFSGALYGDAARNGVAFQGYADTGGASRFFYVAKASRRERNPGLEGMPEREVLVGAAGHTTNPTTGLPVVDIPRTNHHPTVKPVALMRWLVRLVTPPDGLVCDPFAGSGSTGCAAVLEGFDFLGIETSAEYAEIARCRIAHWARQPALPLAAMAD